MFSETTLEIYATKSISTAPDFLCTCRNWKMNKITPSKKWNKMSIVQGTVKGGVYKLFLTDKVWLLKHFNDEHLLNKKFEFISTYNHENKLLVKWAKKWKFCLYLYSIIILVFITKYFAFVFRKPRKRYLKIVERHETQSRIMKEN